MLGYVAKGGIINRGRERRRAAELVEQLDIRARSIDAPVGTLSGGERSRRRCSQDGWCGRPAC